MLVFKSLSIVEIASQIPGKHASLKVKREILVVPLACKPFKILIK